MWKKNARRSLTHPLSNALIGPLKRSMDRRTFGKLTLGALATVGLGAVVRDETAGERDDVARGVNTITEGTRDRAINKGTNTNLQLVLPEVPEVSLPTFEIVDVPDMKLKDAPNMPEAELLKLSRQLTDGLKEMIGSQKPSDVRAFLLLIFTLFAQTAVVNSNFDTDWQEYRKSFPGLKVPLPFTIKWLNRYLEPSGFFLGYYGKGGEHLGLYQIGRKGYVETEDALGKVKAPFIILDNPLITVGREAPVGYTVPVEDRIFVYKQAADLKKEVAAGYSGQPAGDYVEETLRHEATHYLMEQRFPGRNLESGPFNATYSDSRGRSKTVRGTLQMLEANEMMGLGVQWATSARPKAPILEAIFDGGGEYNMARYFAGLAIASLSKASPAKSQIIEGFLSGGKGMSADESMRSIAGLVKSHDFSDDDARKVGEFVYRLGYTHFSSR